MKTVRKSTCKLTSLLLTVIFIISSAQISWANVSSPNGNPKNKTTQVTEAKPSRPRKNGLIVKFKANQNQVQADQVVKNNARKNKPSLKDKDIKVKSVSKKIATVEIQKDETADSLIQSLSDDPLVESVQQDYELQGFSSDTTSPSNINNSVLSSANQWALLNEGQVINGKPGAAGADVNLAPWLKTSQTPSEIVIAVLDTGIDPTHNSLIGKTTAGFDFVNNDSTIFDPGDTYHGTQIASLIAANDLQNELTGAADNVVIMPLKFIQDGYGYTSDALAAIDYAKENGIRIINCSWGSTQFNPMLKDAMAENSDILFVCAAGNSGDSKPVYPAAFDLPNVVSVASIDNTGSLSINSSYGSTSVNLAAPGEDIYTAAPENSYDFASGTSMAAGYVSAAAGMYLGINESVTASQLKSLLTDSVTPSTGLNGYVKSGGYLNISQMLTTDTMPVNDIGEGSTSIESEFDPDTDARNLLNGATLYIDLTEEQKEVIQKTFLVREDTMTECANAELTIKESIRKAIIMQRLNISLSDVLIMIKNYGSEGEAYAQTEYFVLTQYDYRWYNTENANALVKYLIEGYPARNVIFSYVVAQAFEIDQKELIIKSLPSKQDVEDILEWVLHIAKPIAVPAEENAEEEISDGQLDEDTSDEAVDNQLDESTADSGLSTDELDNTSGSALSASADEWDNDTDAEFSTDEWDNISDSELSTDERDKNSDLELTTDDKDNNSDSELTADEWDNNSDSEVFTDELDDVSSLETSTDEFNISGSDFYTNEWNVSSYFAFNEDELVNTSGSALASDTSDVPEDAEIDDSFFESFLDGGNDQTVSGSALQIENLAGVKTTELFKSIIRLYSVNPEVIAQLIVQKGMSVEEFYNALQAFEKENGLFAAHQNTALGVDAIKNIEPSRTEFKINTSDGVNPANGSLDYTDFIASIPGRNGLDLNLALQYNSNQSNSIEAYAMDYTNLGREMYYSSSLQYMANGWSFAFPYLIMPSGGSDASYISYRSSTGEIYQYDASSPSHLKKHLQTDMIFNIDTYSSTYPSAKYCLTYSDGKKEYFDANGRLLAIADRFSNTIKFAYSTNITITDTAGQVTTISKTDTAATITLPDKSVISYEFEKKSITYLKRSISLANTIIIAQATGTAILLKKKTDQLGRVTTYSYSMKQHAYNYYTNATMPNIVYPESGIAYGGGQYTIRYDMSGGALRFSSVIGTTLYNYLSYTSYPDFHYIVYLNGSLCSVDLPTKVMDKPEAANIDYALLTSVCYPSGAQTNYSYSDYSHSTSNGGTYKSSRLLGKHDTTGGKTYNSIIYDYTSPSTDEYIYTNIYYSDGTSKRYYINDQLLNSITLEYNGKTKLSDNYTYNNLRQMTSYNSKTYNDAGTVLISTKEAYSYDSAGNLTSYWDKQSGGSTTNTENVTKYTYGANALLTSKTYKKDASTTITQTNTLSADGKTITASQMAANGTIFQKSTFTYDTYGNILTETKYPSASSTIQITYTYQNGVFPVSRATSGVSNSYTYDSYGNILTEKDGSGYISKYEYDKSGRLTKVTNPDASVRTIGYDNAANKKTETNEIGRKIETAFNGFGYVLTEKDITNASAPVTLHSYTYDSLMRVSQETDARNTVTAYTYDRLDRVLTKTIGGTLYKESYLYEDALTSTSSRVTKTIEGETNAPSMKTVSYTNTYGFNDRIGRVISGAEQLNTFTFDYMGNQLTSKTPDGIVTSFQYDGANRLIKTTNPDSSIYQQAYDWLGRKITATDPKGAVTNYTYDTFNRITKEETPFSGSYKSAKTYYYDANGNITSQRQSNNVPGSAASESRTDYEYNNRNFLIKTSAYNKGAVENYVTYTYDAAGNKLTMAAANGTQITKYTYDSQSRLTKLTDPLGKYETYTYDANNNLITKTDRMNTVITNGYDTLNRLTSITAKKNGTTAATENMTYSYFKTGAKKQEKNENLTTDFVYDDASRLIKQTETTNTTTVVNGEKLMALTIVKSQTYDVRDNRKSFAVTKNDVAAITETYEYDSMNRLSKVHHGGGPQATYTYDLNGNRQSLSYANGVVATYVYNSANLVTSLTNNKDTIVLSSFTYTYKLDGNQASKKDNLGINTTYTYDDLGRLTVESETTPTGIRGATASTTVSISYTFDKANNRVGLTMSKKVGTAATTGYTTAYSYNTNNQLLTEKQTPTTGSVSTITYTYNANGNQISKSTSGKTENYIYDVFNRLSQFSSGGNTTSYRYKADGFRLSVSTKPTTGSSQTTIHVWDGSNIAIEYDGLGNLINKYIRGINLIKSQPSNVSTNDRYYSYNAHGDVVQLTNTQGIGIKNYYYDAFGVEISPGSGDATPWRYTGQFFDISSGITTEDFNLLYNADIIYMAKPSDNVYTNVLRIKPNSVAYTAQIELSQNTEYILEFDYWGDVEGDKIHTDLYPDDLPETCLTVSKTAKRAKLTISSDKVNMSNANVRFFVDNGYGHVNTGNVYVANIRFYNKTTAVNAQYLDISVAVKVYDFTSFYNSSKAVLIPPGSKMAADTLLIRPNSVASTGQMYLKQNTEYILEFDYWGDVNGDKIHTDLYPDDLPETCLTVSNTVKRAKLTISSDKPNMNNAILRFFVDNGYGHVNTGNVYVAKILFYEKNALGAIIDSNPFRYCGEYLDLSSGTYYMRARYYQPTTGRFLTEDPIRNGLNYYTYCKNNPVFYIDPSGLIDVLLTDYIKAFSGSYTWDANTRSATVTVGNKTTTFTDKSNGAYIDSNGKMHIEDSQFISKLGDKVSIQSDDAKTTTTGTITTSSTSKPLPVISNYRTVEYTSIKINNNVAGQKYANEVNNNQNQAVSDFMFFSMTASAYTAGGIIQAVLGSVPVGIGTQALSRYDFSYNLEAGDTLIQLNIIEWKSYFFSPSRPSDIRVDIVVDNNNNLKTYRVNSIN